MRACRFFAPKYVRDDEHGIVPAAADLLAAALTRSAATIAGGDAAAQKRGAGAGQRNYAAASEAGKLAALTALRQLCRGHAAAVPRLAALPVRHAEMMMIVQQLQPRCALDHAAALPCTTTSGSCYRV